MKPGDLAEIVVEIIEGNEGTGAAGRTYDFMSAISINKPIICLFFEAETLVVLFAGSKRNVVEVSPAIAASNDGVVTHVHCR